MRLRRSGTIALVLQVLAQRHGEITQTEAARLAGVSMSWFRHDFKRHTSVSFRTARLQAKLAYGADLLTRSQLSIAEISALLGYSERTKFEKAFKRAQHLTPTAYRRLHHSVPSRSATGASQQHQQC